MKLRRDRLRGSRRSAVALAWLIATGVVAVACGANSSTAAQIEFTGVIEAVPSADTIVIGSVSGASKNGGLGPRLTVRGTHATQVNTARGRHTGWDARFVGPGLPVTASVYSVPDRDGVYTLAQLTSNAR